MVKSYKKLLQSRFEQTIPPSVRDRLIFRPWISDYSDFISANHVADVVLNPFHFGIGTTAISTCSVGTPFVTKPDEFMRGRMGYFFAKLLDATECIASDSEDYAQKAVAIATNPVLRQSIKTKILANNHVLFENRRAIDDVINFLCVVPWNEVEDRPESPEK